MQVRFLLGPAGSGKTFRCLSEIRSELLASPDGLPLVFLAPKQATFQLERQLLADPALTGYTRLQILSFERLAEFIFQCFGQATPELLAAEGRIMVLRALLARKKNSLQLFRASARLPGFATQLGLLLRELQHHRLTPAKLESLASAVEGEGKLGAKLHDLALILRAYLNWLQTHHLQDADRILDLAVALLKSQISNLKSPMLGGLWLDGFAQMTPQEMDLLAALAPHCERMTLAFCLGAPPSAEDSWLSEGALIGQTFLQCHQRLGASLPGRGVAIEVLERNATKSRFAGSSVLQDLERYWARPSLPVSEPALPTSQQAKKETGPASSAALRIVACPNPEAEASFSAREILRFVRAKQARFRDCAVLLRSFVGYEDALRRVFYRFEIPFFLDRRESVAHHPLAELTRSALRTIAFGWQHDDWFGALKTGLVEPEDAAIDRLENEALAQGWRGPVWWQPIRTPTNDALDQWLEPLRRKIVQPFLELSHRLTSGPALSPQGPTGTSLAAALCEFWDRLKVAKTLEKWTTDASGPSPPNEPLLPSDPLVHGPHAYQHEMDAASEPLSSRRGNEADGIVSTEIRLLTSAATGFKAGAQVLLDRAALHETVWTQMQEWLRNLELAFREESLPLNDWLLVIEAGLGALTAGVVPPALDQVLIGTIDRSRNPDLRFAVVLGMNEGVFPASPSPPVLLSPSDRDTLASLGAPLGPDRYQQIAIERYYGYIACTRARERLVLAYSRRDAAGRDLNPSPILDVPLRLFPKLKTEEFPGTIAWNEAEHPSELIAPVLKLNLRPLIDSVPSLEPAISKWRQVTQARAIQSLPPDLAERMYGRELQTSVSALEDFAACPFKFFAARGLRAEERVEFEVDPREKGSFQHEVLQEFHRRLQTEAKRWRDISPAEARGSIRQIGEELLPVYRGGLFLATQAREFAGRMLIESLEKLIGVLIGWAGQNQFDPQMVEVGFGLKESSSPAWRIDLDGRRAVLLRGRIDRVDICQLTDSGDALAIVIDYKSSARALDPVLLQHGLELQLLAYLGTLSEMEAIRNELHVSRLLPAGVFYVTLKSGGGSAKTRDEERAGRELARQSGYQHRGRFDGSRLDRFDNRGVSKGDQFRYSKNRDGTFSKRGNDALPEAEFQSLVAQVKEFLRQHGRGIYAGRVDVAPYRWKQETACDFCAYRAVCRFDPWTQPYRVLRPLTP